MTLSPRAGSAGGEGDTATDADGREALVQILVANDSEVIARLRLSAAEAARVCQVTPRQLIYWTRKGLVRPSVDPEAGAPTDGAPRPDPAERSATTYDVFAMERVIRIRRALEKGHSLEKAAQQVGREMATLAADADRLASMSAEELEGELARRLERLEERVVGLRKVLPASLGLARLRRAVALLARLESQGRFTASPEGDGAKVLALRLGRAVDELEGLLREVPVPA